VTEQRATRAEKQENKGRRVSGCLKNRELLKLSSYCLLSRRSASQGQGSIQMLKMTKCRQSNTKNLV